MCRFSWEPTGHEKFLGDIKSYFVYNLINNDNLTSFLKDYELSYEGELDYIILLGNIGELTTFFTVHLRGEIKHALTSDFEAIAIGSGKNDFCEKIKLKNEYPSKSLDSLADTKFREYIIQQIISSNCPCDLA